MPRVVAVLPAVVGGARDAEVATGGGHGMGARVVQHLQPVLGLPTQDRGSRQASHRLRHPIAQADTRPGADLGEATAAATARLAHEGTSSASWRLANSPSRRIRPLVSYPNW